MNRPNILEGEGDAQYAYKLDKYADSLEVENKKLKEALNELYETCQEKEVEMSVSTILKVEKELRI